MTYTTLIVLYFLTLIALYIFSRLIAPHDSRAAKLARHAINIMTAGLLLVIQKGWEMWKGNQPPAQ